MPDRLRSDSTTLCAAAFIANDPTPRLVIFVLQSMVGWDRFLTLGKGTFKDHLALSRIRHMGTDPPHIISPWPNGETPLSILHQLTGKSAACQRYQPTPGPCGPDH